MWLLRRLRSESGAFALTVLGVFMLGILLVTPSLLSRLPLGYRINEGLDWILRPDELRVKLGDALIIAALLTIGLDRYLKKRLLEDATRDVLAFAAGHALPVEMRNVVRKLLRAPYLRRAFEIRLSVAPLPAHPHFVRLTMTTEYLIEALTDDAPPYEFRTAIEKSPWSSIEKSALLEASVSQDNKKLINCDTQQLTERPAGRPDDDVATYISFEQKLTLSSNMPAKAYTRRSAIYPESYFYVLDILQTTIGVRVLVDQSDEFSWHVYFGATGDVDHQGDRWEHPGVHLAGQFVRISWFKRRAA
jgi:hypothetical protein